MQIVDILGLLVPNVWTALTQLCATAVLFFLMYKLAYKPVKNILDKRSEFEQSRLDQAEALRSENEQLNQEAKQAIAEANKTAEHIVEDAKEEGDALKEEILEEGRAQVRQMKENAQRDIELQRDHMITQMHSQIVDAAILAAEKMLQSKLEEKGDKDSIDSFVKEVIGK